MTESLLERFAALSPALRAVVDEEIAYAAPEPPLVVVAAGAIGRAVVQNDSIDAAPVLALVEEILVSGSVVEKDVVATGLVEAMIAHLHQRPEKRPALLALAGPETRAYWRAWEELCEVPPDGE